MIKIFFVAIISAILIIYLKNANSEFALLVSVVSGLILTFLSLGYVSEIISFFNNIIEISGIDVTMFKLILKIIAIAYLVEFGADILIDFGLKGIADKLTFAGKLIIAITSFPIFYSVFNLLIELL